MKLIWMISNQLIEFGLFDSYSTVDKVNSIKNLANKIIIVSDSGLMSYIQIKDHQMLLLLDESSEGNFPKYYIIAKKVIF